MEACLTADGRYVLSGCGDRSIRAWAVDGGALVAAWEGHAGLPACLKVCACVWWWVGGWVGVVGGGCGWVGVCVVCVCVCVCVFGGGGRQLPAQGMPARGPTAARAGSAPLAAACQ
jgi:hypothetical protein